MSWEPGWYFSYVTFDVEAAGTLVRKEKRIKLRTASKKEAEREGLEISKGLIRYRGPDGHYYPANLRVIRIKSEAAPNDPEMVWLKIWELQLKDSQEILMRFFVSKEDVPVSFDELRKLGIRSPVNVAARMNAKFISCQIPWFFRISGRALTLVTHRR